MWEDVGRINGEALPVWVCPPRRLPHPGLNRSVVWTRPCGLKTNPVVFRVHICRQGISSVGLSTGEPLEAAGIRMNSSPMYQARGLDLCPHNLFFRTSIAAAIEPSRRQLPRIKTKTDR